MVTSVEQVHELIATHYNIKGTYEVDPRTLEVSVHGDAVGINLKQLHVTFDKVMGQFIIDRSDHLVDLKGCPRFVQDYCFINAENLTDLAGAPDHVGGWFKVACLNLTNLTCLPKQGSLKYFLTWNPHMPMLRLLEAQHLIFSYPHQHGGIGVGRRATDIIQKYVGQGKRMMLHCALELKNAGFEGNAKW